MSHCGRICDDPAFAELGSGRWRYRTSEMSRPQNTPVVANAYDTGTTEEPRMAIARAMMVDMRTLNVDASLRPA